MKAAENQMCKKCSKNKCDHKFFSLPSPAPSPNVHLFPLPQLEEKGLHMLLSPAGMIQGLLMKIAGDTKRLPYEETVQILKLRSLEIKKITWSLIELYQVMNVIEKVI